MPSTGRDAVAPVHVVVGLLCDEDRVFITRRHAASHQGGLWEFPGGKLAPGEDARAGLARELNEELGIVVRDAQPYTQVHYVYPERAVLLDVWRITAFTGTAHGREGQEACWRNVGALLPSEFPPADRPILRRLQLSPLYLISDAERLGLDGFRNSLEQALIAGARLVQLRESTFAAADYAAYARDIARLCHRYGAKLLLNADPRVVAECGADGVHLNARRLAALAARPLPPDLLVGASCHDLAELQHAQAIEVDFALLSPVHPTPSHPHASPLGWPAFRALCSATHVPLYALGGLRPSDAATARKAGAAGLAMISGVWQADDIAHAVGTALAG